MIQIILGALFGSLGRHHQGGASHRWIGVALYTPITLWVVYALLSPNPYDWVAQAKTAVLVSGWYGWILMKEEFGNLWHSTWRYGGPVLFACLVTQFWWGLPLMIPAWFTVKWVKETHQGILDPHKIEEFILGGIYGGLWAAVV